MQTIDGDKFINYKECLILLYCNKNRWGEPENHYDLMHPIVQKVGQIEKYIRRNDLQQSNNGETKEAQEKPQKEYKAKMGDYGACKYHNKTNKQKKGRIFNKRKQYGTRITSINLSGSQLHVEFMLDRRKHHVMLIQEHWRLKE
eukprot:16068912-Heterocapsa_arctica.AAC.1